MTSPLERGRRRAEQRKIQAEQLFASHLTSHADIESLFLEKLDLKTKGKISKLISEFRKLNCYSASTGGATYEDFKQCLTHFGLKGLVDEDIRRLFVKYDKHNTGLIQWPSFVKQVAANFAKYKQIGDDTHDIQDARRAREKMRHLRSHAIRTQWRTVNVDAEKILLEKIEQRLPGGQNQLRLAFRRFNRGEDGDSEINFAEFTRTLEDLGLSGLSKEELMVLFKKFDADGNGSIDFTEFVQEVMKRRSSHGGLSIVSTGERDRKIMKAKADRIVNRNIKFHWSFHGRDIDSIETMLQQKIKQKTNGGPHELRRAFGIFNSSRVGDVNIDFNSFKLGLNAIGLTGIPDKQTRRLFRRFDKSRDGVINFQEFLDRLEYGMIPVTQKPKVKEKACCKHCCKHKHEREKLVRLKKLTLSPTL